jgi:ketosteroid isomerase-like protein
MPMAWQKVAALSVALLSLARVLSAAEPAPAPASACTAPEYHQFDFWIGDWDTFDVANPNQVIARNHVEPILRGCVLREDYQQSDGMNGQSFNIYDSSRKIWRQSWVTNRGKSLTLEGTLQSGEMVLTATDREDGKDTLVRGTWKTIDGGVRETAVKSIDGGKTWTPMFDIIFRPHKVSSTPSDDEKAVANLDTEYQAAVKANNVATMDRILADNFVLVTGRGKVYTKSDLLDDARHQREIYEHQEDTDQTVRVFGDTAIVTAKLWEKGTADGKPFDYTVWFSDTYVRTPFGWRYVFGQSSLPLPGSEISAGH